MEYNPCSWTSSLSVLKNLCCFLGFLFNVQAQSFQQTLNQRLGRSTVTVHVHIQHNPLILNSRWINKPEPILGSSTICIQSNPFNYISPSLIALPVSWLCTWREWKKKVQGCLWLMLLLAANTHTHTWTWMCTRTLTHTCKGVGVENTLPIPLGLNSLRALAPYQTISYQWVLMGLPQCITWHHLTLIILASTNRK